MDGGLDSVEKAVPFMPAERVNPSHRSERDKERKFAQTLEEELEEELEKGRKGHDKDSVTLSKESESKLTDQHEQNAEPEPERAEPEETDKDTSPGPEEGHVDLIA
jgi:hypothetical protein